MLRIIADNKIPFLQGALEPYAEVVYMPGSEIEQKHLVKADALLIRTRTKCSEKLLKATAVKFIATATIGFDHIDSAYCESRNIQWTNAPGCNASSVQQYIASLLIHLSRKYEWLLQDKVLGIIGVGHVGSKIEKLAFTIGMKVLLNDPPRERAEGKSNFAALDQVLAESDIVSLHVPLNYKGIDKTFHLASRRFFEKMKQREWFINAARGEVTET